MKRQKLLKTIAAAAKAADLTLGTETTGSEHDIWQCGKTQVSVRRHREVAEYTAEDIIKDLTSELGDHWWR